MLKIRSEQIVIEQRNDYYVVLGIAHKGNKFHGIYFVKLEDMNRTKDISIVNNIGIVKVTNSFVNVKPIIDRMGKKGLCDLFYFSKNVYRTEYDSSDIWLIKDEIELYNPKDINYFYKYVEIDGYNVATDTINYCVKRLDLKKRFPSISFFNM